LRTLTELPIATNGRTVAASARAINTGKFGEALLAEKVASRFPHTRAAVEQRPVERGACFRWYAFRQKLQSHRPNRCKRIASQRGQYLPQFFYAERWQEPTSCGQADGWIGIRERYLQYCAATGSCRIGCDTKTKAACGSVRRTQTIQQSRTACCAAQERSNFAAQRQIIDSAARFEAHHQ
jgi:hypothetical protein